LIDAGSMALRSPLLEPDELAAGLRALDVLAAGLLAVEPFLLEQPLTSNAAAMMATPAACAGRRRRSEVT